MSSGPTAPRLRQAYWRRAAGYLGGGFLASITALALLALAAERRVTSRDERIVRLENELELAREDLTASKRVLTDLSKAAASTTEDLERSELRATELESQLADVLSRWETRGASPAPLSQDAPKELLQESEVSAAIARCKAHHYSACYAVGAFYQMCAEDGICSESMRREDLYSEALTHFLSGCPTKAPESAPEPRNQFACARAASAYTKRYEGGSKEALLEAIRLWRLGCTAGGRSSCVHLAELLTKSRTPQQASVFYAMACIGGDANGCTQLAWSVRSDLPLRWHALQSGCALEDPAACDSLHAACKGGRSNACDSLRAACKVLPPTHRACDGM